MNGLNNIRTKKMRLTLKYVHYYPVVRCVSLLFSDANLINFWRFYRITDLVNVNPLHLCSSWTCHPGHIQIRINITLASCETPPTFRVATSMANSTATAMKVMPSGPPGRSSPEGSQVSPYIYFFFYLTEPRNAAGLGCCTNIIL